MVPNAQGHPLESFGFSDAGMDYRRDHRGSVLRDRSCTRNGARERARARLLESARGNASRRVDFSTFDALPAPVARYLRYALTDGQPLIRSARLEQSGKLRTEPSSPRWLPFRARHCVVPPAIGFVWDASVRLPLGVRLRVADSYVDGVGGGSVSFLSVLPVAVAARARELDSGALHRYLAEAVWFPTALLPESGVVWSAIDDRSARATLENGCTSVSLEFRFNDVGEVVGIYTPKRFGRFRGKSRSAGWEGRFSDYALRAGMRVPRSGEVGWYDDSGVLRMVWIGTLLDAEYGFESTDPARER